MKYLLFIILPALITACAGNVKEEVSQGGSDQANKQAVANQNDDHRRQILKQQQQRLLLLGLQQPRRQSDQRLHIVVARHGGSVSKA